MIVTSAIAAGARPTARNCASTRRFFCILAAHHALGAGGEPLPYGPAQRTLDVGGTPIEIFTYKPPAYAGWPLLLSLHGTNRNAEGYRDYSKTLVHRFGFVVAVPGFDGERFPSWRYQAGGIARSTRQSEGPLTVEPATHRTGHMLLEIISQIRSAEARPDLPYYLLGHSAGGQLLSRFAAFEPSAAQRIIITNPSTYVWPMREARFPYGFGGLPPALSDDVAIRRYLAQPVTIFLGQADIKRDRNLNVLAPAMRQGPHRYQRGLNVFQAAQTLAQEKGWDFNWRLVEVPGVGHSARRMYASPQAAAALFGE